MATKTLVDIFFSDLSDLPTDIYSYKKLSVKARKQAMERVLLLVRVDGLVYSDFLASFISTVIIYIYFGFGSLWINLNPLLNLYKYTGY